MSATKAIETSPIKSGRCNIDILVDLMGYTSDTRSTAILAQRPAPVQVAYLGYAGTTGASFVDYLIADRMVIPPSHQMHYLEKIAYLPHSFMPHDIKGREISDKPSNTFYVTP